MSGISLLLLVIAELLDDAWPYIVLGILALIFLINGKMRLLILTVMAILIVAFAVPLADSYRYRQHVQKLAQVNIIPSAIDLAGKSVLVVFNCTGLRCEDYSDPLSLNPDITLLHGIRAAHAPEMVKSAVYANASGHLSFDISILRKYFRDPRPANPRRAFLHRLMPVEYPDIDVLIFVDDEDILATAHAEQLTKAGIDPRRIWNSFAIINIDDARDIDLKAADYQMLVHNAPIKIERAPWRIEGWHITEAPPKAQIDPLLNPLFCAENSGEYIGRNCGYPRFD